MKQRVIMVSMRIIWALDAKKIAYELSGSFAKVGAPQADNESSKPPKNFNKNVFPAENFAWKIL